MDYQVKTQKKACGFHMSEWGLAQSSWVEYKDFLGQETWVRSLKKSLSFLGFRVHRCQMKGLLAFLWFWNSDFLLNISWLHPLALTSSPFPQDHTQQPFNWSHCPPPRLSPVLQSPAWVIWKCNLVISLPDQSITGFPLHLQNKIEHSNVIYRIWPLPASMALLLSGPLTQSPSSQRELTVL